MKRLIRKAEKIFNIGDTVIYKTHPYDNITPYEVKEVLENDKYFIANDDNAYTGIHAKNLELLS